MSPLRQTLACLSFVLAFFLCGHLQAGEWIVPAASHAPGASNTNWRTDLRIVNPADSAVSVRIDLLQQNADNGARSHTVNVNVPAGGQLSLGDILGDKFGFTGNGALYVSSSQDSLVVTSRTYNQAANGSTYGQFIPGVPVSAAISGQQQRGNLIYLAKNDGYRTNVGFAGTTATAGNVTVHLYDANGLSLGSNTFAIQPYGQIQVNDVFGAVGAASTGVARAEVTSTVPVVAYSSVIDNSTGDPVAMIAQHDTEAYTELAIPAAGHSAGAGGSAWRSDVRIFNPNDRSTAVTVSFYPGNVANPTAQTKVISLSARQILALDDVVLNTFQNDNANGALRIKSDQKLMVTSRTYNQSASGTFGQDIPAVPLENKLTTSDAATFSGLSDSGYRTNLGFFNLTEGGLDLTLKLKGTDGAIIATKTFHLDGNEMTQLNLFSFMGVPGTSLASLTLSAAGSGSYVAYASIIDNASGDPVFVPAARVTAPSGGGDTGSCVTVPLMRAGLKLSYTTTSGGSSYTKVTTVVSDAPAQQVISEKDLVSGYDEQIDSTFTWVIQNGFRTLTHAVSHATTSVYGFDVVVNTDSTFSVPMVNFPVSSYCAGTTWLIPATDQTVVVTGTAPTTTVLHRPANTGGVLAVNETLTNAAGTFNTVKFRGVVGGTEPGVQSSISWVDLASGALVRENDLDASGNVVATFELTHIE